MSAHKETIHQSIFTLLPIEEDLPYNSFLYERMILSPKRRCGLGAWGLMKYCQSDVFKTWIKLKCCRQEDEWPAILDMNLDRRHQFFQRKAWS